MGPLCYSLNLNKVSLGQRVSPGSVASAKRCDLTVLSQPESEREREREEEEKMVGGQ